MKTVLPRQTISGRRWSAQTSSRWCCRQAACPPDVSQAPGFRRTFHGTKRARYLQARITDAKPEEIKTEDIEAFTRWLTETLTRLFVQPRFAATPDAEEIGLADILIEDLKFIFCWLRGEVLRDGIATRRLAADMEGRDVDAGIAQGRREFADEARLVEIGDVDHRGAKFGVHANALDVDDARAAVRVDGAGHMARLAIGRHRKLDQAFVVTFGFAPRLLDDDAAILGDGWRRDHIDVLQHGRRMPAIAADVSARVFIFATIPS